MKLTTEQMRAILALEGWEVVVHNASFTVVRLDKGWNSVWLASGGVRGDFCCRWDAPRHDDRDPGPVDDDNPRLAACLTDLAVQELFSELKKLGWLP